MENGCSIEKTAALRLHLGVFSDRNKLQYSITVLLEYIVLLSGHIVSTSPCCQVFYQILKKLSENFSMLLSEVLKLMGCVHL